MRFPILKDGSEQIRYINPGFPVYTAIGSLSNYTNMTFLCHWHDDFEVIIPIEGHKMYSVDGEHILLECGDILFVNSRRMHYGYSADGSDCRYLCLTFNPALLCGNEHIAASYVQPIINCANLSHAIVRNGEPGHADMFNTVQQIIDLNSTSGSPLSITSHLYSLWDGIYSVCESSLAVPAVADADVAAQRMMLEFIHTHYAEKLSLDMIAASGNVCRTRCCKIFKKYMRRSPVDYLNAYRLEKGMQLLKNTHISMTEIAEKCGFGSASYFTELFTRLKGCPPTKYRQM